MKLRPIFLSLVAACGPNVSSGKTTTQTPHASIGVTGAQGETTMTVQPVPAHSDALPPTVAATNPTIPSASSTKSKMPVLHDFEKVELLGLKSRKLLASTYVAMREAGDQRGSFGGSKSIETNGRIIASVGTVGACASQLKTLQAGFSSRRAILICRNRKLVELALEESSNGFLSVVKSIDDPEIAAILAWLRGYDYPLTKLSGESEPSVELGKSVAYVRKGTDGFELLMERSRIVCDQPSEPADGSEPIGFYRDRVWLKVTASGVVAEEATVVASSIPNSSACRPMGRRPAVFSWARGESASELGHYCAIAHVMEAISIPAFARLTAELADFAAPTSLVTRAKQAQFDEMVHAEVMSTLRKQLGATELSFEVATFEKRSLYAMLSENAVEGCVLETFAALRATYQSAHATHLPLRLALQKIALDETRHAELAWDVHRWGMSQLTKFQQQEIAQRQWESIGQLRDSWAELSIELQRQTGEPSANVYQRLLAGMQQMLSLTHDMCAA